MFTLEEASPLSRRALRLSISSTVSFWAKLSSKIPSFVSISSSSSPFLPSFSKFISGLMSAGEIGESFWPGSSS